MIELLVVVAILLVLAGLLLGGVRRARQRADTAYCLNNQRQLTLAWTLYSQDYDDRLAPNLDGEPGPRTNWIGGSMAEPSQATNRLILADPGRSLLAPYFRDPALLRCPADESDHVRSVALNCRMNPVRRDNLPPRWVSGGGGAKYATFHKLGEVQRPAGVFVFVDEAETSINDGYFAVDHSHTGDPDGQGAPRPYYLIDWPAVRHAGGATFGFADGHAVAKRWRDPGALREVTPRKHVGPQNEDVRWLLEHATHER